MNYLIKPVKFRRGGRILEKVDLKNYTGRVMIDINNIIQDPSWNEIVKKQLKTSFRSFGNYPRLCEIQ